MHISNPAVRRARFCARVFAPLAAALILSPPARARLGDDFLDSGAYEREDILREFERLEPPPKPSAPAAAGGKKRIALVLPISETGAIGIAARALRDGFSPPSSATARMLRSMSTMRQQRRTPSPPSSPRPRAARA